MAFLLLVLTLSACGSSGSAADAGGSLDAAVPGSGTLLWKDDGVALQAGFSSLSLVRSMTVDFLQIRGGTTNDIAIALEIDQTPPLMPGRFQCGPSGGGPIVSFTYAAPNVGSTALTCTIVLATLGVTGVVQVTGSFSATVPLATGGTKAITEGSFDLTGTTMVRD